MTPRAEWPTPFQSYRLSPGKFGCPTLSTSFADRVGPSPSYALTCAKIECTMFNVCASERRPASLLQHFAALFEGGHVVTNPVSDVLYSSLDFAKKVFVWRAFHDEQSTPSVAPERQRLYILIGLSGQGRLCERTPIPAGRGIITGQTPRFHKSVTPC